MRDLILIVSILFCFLALPLQSSAELIQLDFTEVDADASGAAAPPLRETIIECCKAKTATISGCKVWERVATFPSDDANGLDVKTLSNIEIEIKASEMPMWLHCCGTSITTTGDIGNRGGCDSIQRP